MRVGGHHLSWTHSVRCFAKIVGLFSLPVLIVVLTFKTRSGTTEDGHIASVSAAAAVESSTHLTCSAETRLALLHDRCRQEGWRREPVRRDRLCRNLMVSHRHKLIYCDIPKCGSKSFKTFIGRLARKDFVTVWAVRMHEYHNKTGVRMLCDLPVQEQRLVLRNYYKFVVVRHPFDRLRSAWQHKLSTSNKSHAINGVASIVENHFQEKHVNNGTFNQSSDVLDFKTFLELVSTKYDQRFRNPHWNTYYERCQPCHVRYEGIFKLETLTDDEQQLYDHLSNVTDVEQIPALIHTNNERREVSDKLAQVSQLYRELNADTVEGLLRVYARDMALFGYTWSRENGAGCSMETDNGTCC